MGRLAELSMWLLPMKDLPNLLCQCQTEGAYELQSKNLVKMAEAGERVSLVSLSTVKRVLYLRGLKGHLTKKKPLLKKQHKKAKLRFANA